MISAASIVDAVLVVLLIETVVLAVARRRMLKRTAFRDVLPNLAAGFLLLLALRAVVHDDGTVPMAGFLALAGIAHVIDLVRRRR